MDKILIKDLVTTKTISNDISSYAPNVVTAQNIVKEISVVIQQNELPPEIVKYSDIGMISTSMTDFIEKQTSFISNGNWYNYEDPAMSFEEHSWWEKSGTKIIFKKLEDQYSYRAIEVPLEAGKTYNIQYSSTASNQKVYNAFAVDDNYNKIETFVNNDSNTFLMSDSYNEQEYRGKTLFNVFTMPEGSTKLCFSLTTGSLYNVLYIREGTYRFPCDPYQPVYSTKYSYDGLEDVIKRSDIKPISAKMTDFVDVKQMIMNNLYDFNTMCSELHYWWQINKENTGIKVLMKQVADQFNYYAIEIPVNPGQTYRIWYNSEQNNWYQLYNVFATDCQHHVVETILNNSWRTIDPIKSISDSEAQAQGKTMLRTITVPENATRLLISTNSVGLVNCLCLNEGTEKIIPVIPYSETPTLSSYYIYKDLEDVERHPSKLKLMLPDSFNILSGIVTDNTNRACSYAEIFFNDSVYGDSNDTKTFQAYIKENAYCYSYGRYCSIRGYKTGKWDLNIKMFDNTMNELDSKTLSVNVLNANELHSPETNKTILVIGDSLTQNGGWVNEFMRMLTADNGSPIGLGLSNLQAIGSKFISNENVRFEGFGGWSYINYNTAYQEQATVKWFECQHSLTSADLMAVYQDQETQQIWVLTDIKQGMAKLMKNSGSSDALSSPGTFVHISGGTSIEDINYTGTSAAVANPFWNEDSNAVDFQKYAQDRSVSSIDYCYVFLGWNNVGTDDTTLKSQILTLIGNIHSAFPNCQIMLVGLQKPSKDGCGMIRSSNSFTSSEYVKYLNHSFRMKRIYEEIANENENTYYVHLASFFDSKYGYSTSNVKVNYRSTVIEERQNNNVHPNASGYLQIADAITRDFIGRI